jgi:hypothetical protein
MTPKAIAAYLGDECQNGIGAQLRTEEDAARIQPPHRGHHSTPNRSKLALLCRVEAVGKERKCRSGAEKAGAARKLATKVHMGLDSEGRS